MKVVTHESCDKYDTSNYSTLSLRKTLCLEKWLNQEIKYEALLPTILFRCIAMGDTFDYRNVDEVTNSFNWQKKTHLIIELRTLFRLKYHMNQGYSFKRKHNTIILRK